MEMQRWEFCYVDLLNRTMVRPTPEGLERVKFKRDKNLPEDTKEDAAGRAVARLGLEGWELVNGFGDIQPILFFRRRLP